MEEIRVELLEKIQNGEEKNKIKRILGKKAVASEQLSYSNL